MARRTTSLLLIDAKSSRYTRKLHFFWKKQAETGGSADPGTYQTITATWRDSFALTWEHSMNYVHPLFRSWGVGVMVRAVVEDAATLASLALFLGMVAIWAQVIATL